MLSGSGAAWWFLQLLVPNAPSTFARFYVFCCSQHSECSRFHRLLFSMRHLLWNVRTMLYFTLQFGFTLRPNFFFSRCNNGLKSALIKDLSNPEILRQLRILGLLGKVISDPWMVQFYGNKMNRKHLQMVPLMQQCIKYLESVNEDPSVILKGMISLLLNILVSIL